jgi:hypothetical protein
MTSLTGSKGATGNFSGDIIPKGYKAGQLQQFTPEQMQLFQQMFSNVGPGSFLSRLAGGDESMFQQMEAPALRQFGELQGGLSSRFSGMGMGARNSSGFQNTMTQAGSSLAQDLASKRQDLQRQAIMDLMGLSSNLLSQNPYERFLYEKQKKEKTPWGKYIGGGIGAIGGAFAGGPVGAMQGAQMGSSLGSMFD